MENKKSKGLVVVIIILIVLIIGESLYILYSKGLFDSILKDKEIVATKDTNKSEESNTINEDANKSEEEIQELLKKVPFNYFKNINVVDAYTKSKVTAEDVSDSLLLTYAFTKLDDSDILKYKTGMPIPEGLTEKDMTEKDEDGNLSSEEIYYFNPEKIKNIASQEYHKSNIKSEDFYGGIIITDDKTSIIKSIDELKDNKGICADDENKDYYPNCSAELFTMKDSYYYNYSFFQKSALNKHSKVLSYKLDNDTLIIDEKMASSYCFEGLCLIFKDNSSFDKKDSINSCVGDNCIKEWDAEKYFENNIDNFNTYRHIFKKQNDGNYYWYSTELNS